jgi:RNA polymerase sigma factor (sigma-70 family)
MHHTAGTKRFEELFRPHMDAAYNLARWLTRNESAAQDIVQESYLRALRSLNRFAGGNARAWLLTIVRNQSYTWLKSAGGNNRWVNIGDELEEDNLALADMHTPERDAISKEDTAHVQQTLEALPPIFREVIILKELEEMSYKDIATVTGVPIGTVMSRLARGRLMLKTELLKLYPYE